MYRCVFPWVSISDSIIYLQLSVSILNLTFPNDFKYKRAVLSVVLSNRTWCYDENVLYLHCPVMAPGCS